MPFDQTLRELPNYNYQQLKDITAGCKLLMQGMKPEPVTDEGWVLGLIVTHLHENKIEYTTVDRLRKSNAITQFREHLPMLMQYFAAQQLNQVQCYGIIEIGLRILHKQMTDMHVPCGGTTVLRHINRIPALLESQFPGYARCGMLKMIVRFKQGSKNVRSQRSRSAQSQSA